MQFTRAGAVDLFEIDVACGATSCAAMLIDDVERLVRREPGLTATELARNLFGNDGYHSRLIAECRALIYAGWIERRDSGGPGDPFRYFQSRPRRRRFDNYLCQLGRRRN